MKRSMSRRGWWRRPGPVAALVGLSMLANACVGGGSKSGSDAKGTDPKYAGTVQFWTINLKKNYNDYITGLINGYEKQHPKVKVDWVDVPGQDIATKLIASLASGKVPDAVNIDSANLGQFRPSLADLTPYFPKSDLSDFQSNLVNSLRGNGKLYAVPWYNGGAPVGIFNKSVVDRAGFDVSSPPQTYDDALALAQKTYDTTKVYGMNDLPTYTVLQYYGLKVLSDDKKKAAFDTPEAAAVLQRFKKAYDAHAIAPGAITKDTRNYPQSIDNGQLAFTPSSLPFSLLNYQQNSPNIYKKLVVTKAVHTTDGKYLLAGQQTFAVPKASKHKQAASEFIKYVTDAANQLAFCKIVTIYPSTVSSAKNPFFTHIEGNTLADQARRIAVSELPQLEDGQLGTGHDAELAQDFSDQLAGFIQGQKTAKQALSAAAAQWNKLLAGGS
jgi:multiple sugar transport system substrate-binding protein/putative chitobiose transport system substrate-binding protein